MPQFYDRARRRLIYVEQEADAEFWDEHWAGLTREAVLGSGRDSLVVPLTERYLPPPAKVLEAGCGTGRYCAALRAAGYQAIGLDFAVQTLRRVKQLVPELPLTGGDVFHLPLANGAVDGLWSLGVIEHFWDGYRPIVGEMRRVIRPGGMLFLSQPYLADQGGSPALPLASGGRSRRASTSTSCRPTRLSPRCGRQASSTFTASRCSATMGWARMSAGQGRWSGGWVPIAAGTGRSEPFGRGPTGPAARLARIAFCWSSGAIRSRPRRRKDSAWLRVTAGR